MYTYKIMCDNFQIGTAKGKRNAVKFIEAILNRDDKPGVWIGLKCTAGLTVYTIERE